MIFLDFFFFIWFLNLFIPKSHFKPFLNFDLFQAKTHYTQPLYKTQTITQHVAQPVAHVAHTYAAAPVVAAAPAPAVKVEAAAPVEVAAVPASIHGLGYYGHPLAGYPYGAPLGAAIKTIEPLH